MAQSSSHSALLSCIDQLTGTQCSCFCPAAPLALVTASDGGRIDTHLCYFPPLPLSFGPVGPGAKWSTAIHVMPRGLVPVQYMQTNTNVALTVSTAVASPPLHPFSFCLQKDRSRTLHLFLLIPIFLLHLQDTKIKRARDKEHPACVTKPSLSWLPCHSPWPPCLSSPTILPPSS